MFAELMRFIKITFWVVLLAVFLFVTGWYAHDYKPDLLPKIAFLTDPSLVVTPAPSPAPSPAPISPKEIGPQPVVDTQNMPAPTPSADVKKPEELPVGEARVGNLYIKARSAGLRVMETNTGSHKQGSLTLTIQNLGQQPISLAVADSLLVLHYNGSSSVNCSALNDSRCLSGLHLCHHDMETCRNAKPLPFVQVEPNSSPITVTISADEYVDPQDIKTLASVKTVSFSTVLHAIDGDTTKDVTIGVNDFPVENLIQ